MHFSNMWPVLLVVVCIATGHASAHQPVRPESMAAAFDDEIIVNREDFGVLDEARQNINLTNVNPVVAAIVVIGAIVIAAIIIGAIVLVATNNGSFFR